MLNAKDQHAIQQAAEIARQLVEANETLTKSENPLLALIGFELVKSASNISNQLRQLEATVLTEDQPS